MKINAARKEEIYCIIDVLKRHGIVKLFMKYKGMHGGDGIIQVQDPVGEIITTKPYRTVFVFANRIDLLIDVGIIGDSLPLPVPEFQCIGCLICDYVHSSWIPCRNDSLHIPSGTDSPQLPSNNFKQTSIG